MQQWRRAVLQDRSCAVHAQLSIYADIQALDPGACLRADVARSCDVRGCMLVPLFPHPNRRLVGPVAVLELVQREADVFCFPALFNWLLEKLPVRPAPGFLMMCKCSPDLLVSR